MSRLTYTSFGAIGDGVTDDFEAILKTHEYANENGLSVYAEGKTYYIGRNTVAARIMTDTDWTGATFIIDDRDIKPDEPERQKAVFFLTPDVKPYEIGKIEGLRVGNSNVGMKFNEPTVLHISDPTDRQYIRFGENANAGVPKQEIILVDEEGNVDPSTPILWDYTSETTAVAYPAGDKPITVKGGTFITRANSAPRAYTYYARNINIRRSNATIDGITHLITDEEESGAPYSGFLTVAFCNNVTISNATITGHKVYKLATNVNNSMGTYELSFNSANAVTVKNSRQTNDITDTTFWGVMGSNFCKNITYDGCIFSRFDAHQGTYNATIKNSEIGHQKLSVIGKGTLYVENTVFHSDTVVALRGDYGCTWQGDVVLKNITVNNIGTPILVNAGWHNHYFGYTCYLPERIVVDGIKLANKDYFYVLPKLAPDIDKQTVDGVENKNPVELTKEIIIKNNSEGYKHSLSVNTELFKNVKVITE